MAGETSIIGFHQSLVTKIVTKYLSRHQLTPEQIPDLIASVHHSLNSLGQVAPPPPVLTPAVPVRRSVQKDMVVCLDCGWKGKMLRRHLTTRHQLTGEQYLQRWSLPNDHPLTAPMYSEQRSALAKELGLGRGGRPG
jgi:predicted transcriptional regulator